MRVVIAAIAGVLLALGAVAPAHAAPAGVVVSTDGVHWSDTLPGGLFPDLRTIVPGGSETATLYVKNESSVDAALRISATDMVASAPEFAAALSLRAATPAAPGTAAPLDPTKACSTLLDRELLGAGDTVAVAITFAMADVDGSVAQGETAGVRLSLALTEASAPRTPVSACPLDGIQLPVLPFPGDDAPAEIAFTGAAVLYPALVVATVLLGVGGWLFAAGRRRRRARA